MKVVDLKGNWVFHAMVYTKKQKEKLDVHKLFKVLQL